MPDRVTMKPVECETEDVSYVRESRSAALARKAVTRTIMRRLSPLYRAFSTYHSTRSTMQEPKCKNLCNPFRDSETHQKLRNKFFIEYLAKGTDGLPIRGMEMDPRHGGQTYFNRVMQNYENKAPDYGEKLQICHQQESARSRKIPL